MDKKTLTKKIVLTVLLGLLIAVGILYMIFQFPAFLHYSETILIYKENFPQESLVEVLRQYKLGILIILFSYFFIIGNTIVDICIILSLWRNNQIKI